MTMRSIVVCFLTSENRALAIFKDIDLKPWLRVWAWFEASLTVTVNQNYDSPEWAITKHQTNFLGSFWAVSASMDAIFCEMSYVFLNIQNMIGALFSAIVTLREFETWLLHNQVPKSWFPLMKLKNSQVNKIWSISKSEKVIQIYQFPKESQI